MANFHIDLYDAAGTRKAVLSTEVRALNYQARVNYPGKVTFELDGDHEMVSQILPGWRCDVWRLLPTGTWRKEMISFIEDSDWKFTDRSTIIYTASGVLSLLSKRRVAWYANTNSKSAFSSSSKAEDIAVALVYFNIGAAATTANGRILNGVDSRIGVPASGNRGNTLPWYCAWANLLDTLQKLAKVGGGDFNLVPVGSSYYFYWYPGQLGTDRTASVIFSLERGNIANPRHILSTNKAVNVVIVGGKGENSARMVTTVQASGYSAATHSEEFLDATDVDTTDALTARGNGKLEDLKAVSEFKFDILQSQYTNFNVEYFLGDLVKVINSKDSSVVTSKIDSATISFDSDGRETIKIGVL